MSDDWSMGRAVPWSVRNAIETGEGAADVIKRQFQAAARREERINALEIALNRIVGHANITVDKAKKIAAEALGEPTP